MNIMMKLCYDEIMSMTITVSTNKSNKKTKTNFSWFRVYHYQWLGFFLGSSPNSSNKVWSNTVILVLTPKPPKEKKKHFKVTYTLQNFKILAPKCTADLV